MSQHAVTALHPSTGTSPPTPTPQPHQPSQRVSKAILKTAIQKANSAVVLDKANNLTGAIEAYTEAINLLDRVLSSETRESDRQRLQETYDKYLKRIEYLNTLKSDADDLYETFENGSKKDNEKLSTTNTIKQSLHQQGKGRKDTWVRKMASSSSLDSKTNRLDMGDTSSKLGSTTTATRYGLRMSDGAVPNTTRWQQRQHSVGTNSTTMTTTGTTTTNSSTTPTSPSSSSILMSLDVPPSPVSSESTPSRPSSHRKSNDTINPSTDPPPLEPRSIHRPSPRKSSRTAAAAALSQTSTTSTSSSGTTSSPAGQVVTTTTVATTAATTAADQDQPLHSPRQRSSMSSLSSTSSADSDIICVSSPHQPTMALPSLLHTKMEATTETTENNSPTVERNKIDNNDDTTSPHEGSLKLNSTSSMSTMTLSRQDETPSSSGRLRTSSLPRKLHFTRPVIGSSSRTQRLASNASSIDSNPDNSSSTTPTRKNGSQPISSTIGTSSSSSAIDTDNSVTNQTPVQRQSSGLSMRKKYNRLSRSSMDGVSGIINGGNGNSGSGGRKDKSGPIFSTLFGGGGNNPQSVSHGQEAMNYFGKSTTNTDTINQQGLDSTNQLMEGKTGTMATYQPYRQEGSVPPSRYLDIHLKLIIALEHSMNYGGYITPKLFIPKNLWHQTNIRLSSMDVKVAACESLILDLNRIEKWRNLDDIRGSLRLIESLEEVVDGLQVTLSKKFKRDSLADTNDDNNSILYSSDGPGAFQTIGNQQYSGINGGNNNMNNNVNNVNKRAQFMSWGSKLSKSVERMNAFSLTKVEDQHRHYMEVLQKLFIKLHMLEMWFQHYLKKDRQKNPHYDALLSKLGKVCDGINRVVGGFVLRDVAILLGKWLKRGGVWVNE
ncbi:uncharacterized protein BX664DRAFT_359429 [Halteromyces radiatus]|uniref:uncharacterized protein n=1 Tax=Halteromyces radiatus TaxID=101107 RepID=UPI00221EAE88|nr:uncharacterized protein BX664DRAFT_359429 [Halteromyces radiatus]KAI8089948.1 hypothetical protein BX664DRAFT_359429 [Halteromyces radiatus]